MKILYSIKSKTANQIGQILNLPVVKSLTTLDYRPGMIIRWGRTTHFEGKQLNTAEAVEKASNKVLCRKLLQEAGLPIPKPTETDFPVIGRPAKHHSGYRFYVCRTSRDVRRAKRRGAEYFSQYYPKKNEYRVHIASDKCILMSVKKGNKNKRIWNKRKNGFYFRHMHRSEWINDNHLMNMVKVSKEAIKLIGLDFGAVDILADAEGGFPPFVICEINTAPALSPLAINKYIKYFRKQLNPDYPLI